MNSTRIISFTLCLGLACVLATGNVLAGTTVADELSYAREVGAADVSYTIPTPTLVTRTMAVLRSGGGPGNFFLTVTLSNNLEFTGTAAGLPDVTDLTQTAGAPLTQATIAFSTAPVDGASTMEFSVNLPADYTTFPSFTLDPGAVGANGSWVLRDADNILGTGGTISITVSTRDANTGLPVDVGTDIDGWLSGAFGVTTATPAVVATTAIIDVGAVRQNLVAGQGGGADTTTIDADATVGVDGSAGPLFASGATAFTLAVTDFVDLVITGDLTGITTITWSVGGSIITLNENATAFDKANNIATLRIPGTNAALTGGATAVTLTIDGSTTLNPRTLQIAVNLDLVTAGLTANDRNLVPATTLTVWTLNGTVLIANFINGNNGLFNSRVYLFNPGSLAGDVNVRVFTLPLTGPSTLLGSVNLGTLSGLSGKNIRVAEDVLTPLSIALPYVADGGNLVLEITIEASNVTGNAQVFQLDLSSFGIYNLQSL